jgi:putative ABC transport system permease protein
MNDLRFALRQLLKNPGFTAVAVLTLALGIGATAAVFSLIQGVLLMPPPYPDPKRIVLVTPQKVNGQSTASTVAGRQWIAWQKDRKSFQSLAGYGLDFAFLILPDGSQHLRGLDVTPEYFRVLGIKPILGREFTESDAAGVGDNSWPTVVIISHALWQQRFNADSGIIGKTIQLRHNASPPVTLTLTVVGVMPHGIRFLPSPRSAGYPNYDADAPVDYWFPVPADAESSWWNVVGRLSDGITVSQAQAEVAAITARQAQAEPNFEGMTAKVQPLTVVTNHEGRRLLLPLLGAVVLVFLIACSNVAGLLLAQGLRRQQEYVVRCALGAARLRLFRQALTETLLLALLSGALGTGLTVGVVRVFKVIGGFAIPRLDAVLIGWPVLASCFGLAVMAAAVAGLLPAIRASRQDPARGIKNAGRASSTGCAERRLLQGLAVLQTALTLALLMGAGLLIRTAHNLARVRPGYETQNILTMSVSTMADASMYMAFHVQALARISAIPGVSHAAFGWGLPLTGNKFENASVRIEGQPDAEKLTANGRAVTPEYFDALGMKLQAGRGFRSTDTWNDWNFKTHTYVPGETPFVAIINEVLAEKCFPNANPIGKKLRTFPWQNRPCEIVGVVANSRTETLTEKPGPEIYWCYWQFPPFTKHLLVRTMSDARQFVGAVQHELRAVDPTVAIDQVKTFEQIRDDSVASQTFAMRLLAGFSVVACVLALVGIYGVLTLSVNSRKREMAIRTAVGAQRRHILSLVLSEGAQLIAIGLVLGIGIAAVLARVLQTFLFGVESTDPATFVGVMILFSSVALLACYWPARRAAKIDLMEALRHE